MILPFQSPPPFHFAPDFRIGHASFPDCFDHPIMCDVSAQFSIELSRPVCNDPQQADELEFIRSDPAAVFFAKMSFLGASRNAWKVAKKLRFL